MVGVRDQIIREALGFLATRCRYHGEDFGFLGWEVDGRPRCGSCKEPWHRARALAALAAAPSGATSVPLRDRQPAGTEVRF